jgi:hypothetical protein
MSIPPIPFRWDGEAMVPRRPKLADQHYCIGEDYILVPHEERSEASHRHFFAEVREAWANLPEGLAEQYPSPESLRKRALIKAGFRDERSIVCASKAEALRVASFIKGLDDYDVVAVSGATVLHWRAKSQSQKAMGKEAFQQSKEAVLGILADMLDVTPDQLGKAAA